MTERVKRIPFYLRKVLLPATSLIDTVLLPQKVNLKFYEDARYFLGGLHVVCWLRLMFIPILMLIFTMFETCIQEAALIANQLYQKQQSFSPEEIIEQWDKGSFTYDALKLEIFLTILFVWLVIVTAVRRLVCFVPMHLFGLFVLVYFIYKTFVDQYVRIQNEIHIIHNMNQVKRDLRSLRLRAYEFPMISVPYEFAPFLRTVFEFGMLAFMFFFVYVIERCMLFYGYEEFLYKFGL